MSQTIVLNKDKASQKQSRVYSSAAETKLIFSKDRSIKACMADAWRMIALHWKDYVKALWPYLLLAGMTSAFYVETNLQYVKEQALPALLLQESGGNAEVVKLLATPTAFNLTISILSFVLLVFGWLCFTSRLFKVIRHYADTDAMPQKLPIALDATDLHCMMHIFSAALATIAGFLLISAPFIFIAIKWSIWAMVALPLIVLYFSSFGVLSVLRHALYDYRLAPSILYALKHAFGQVFILMLLTAIPVGIALLITSLPQATYVSSEIAFTQSLIMGDNATMPWGVPLACFIVNSLCTAIGLLISSYFTWAIGLKVRK